MPAEEKKEKKQEKATVGNNIYNHNKGQTA